MGKKSRRRNKAPSDAPKKNRWNTINRITTKSGHDVTQVVHDFWGIAEHLFSDGECTNEHVKVVIDVVDEDGWEVANKWALKGRVDAAGLAKHLPHTSKALRDEKINPKVFAGLLWCSCGSDKTELGKEIEFVANLVREEHDLIRDKCWECDTLCVEKYKCSGCSVAIYCNRDCQAKAWEDGHKDQCKKLNSAFINYKNNERVIGNFYRTNHGFVHKGFQYHKMLDMMIASSKANLNPDKAYIQVNDVRLRGPSMEVFYENMRKMINGEWWLFDRSSQEDVDDLFRGKEQPDAKFIVIPFDKEKLKYFVVLSCLLCYDHCAYFEEHKGITEPSAIAADPTFQTYVQAFLKLDENRREISAETYLQLYKRSSKICESSTFRTYKDDAAQFFRESLHK